MSTVSKPTWQEMLSNEKKQPYFVQTIQAVSQARDEGKIIHPAKEDVFNAFRYTELDQVKVVILGQDPYHGPNQAHGLCFSVLPSVKPPPSLINIYKELANSIEGFVIPQHGFLKSWALQGVLLLNTVLTVEQGKAHSHAHLGWEQFTDRVIDVVNANCEAVVFLLWGSHARKKCAKIDRNRHFVLEAPHPSPLSAHRGFLGCGHFAKANQYLIKKGKVPINWHLT